MNLLVCPMGLNGLGGHAWFIRSCAVKLLYSIPHRQNYIFEAARMVNAWNSIWVAL